MVRGFGQRRVQVPAAPAACAHAAASPLPPCPLSAFLAVARDDETNKIFYEDYVAYLTGQRALTKL